MFPSSQRILSLGLVLAGLFIQALPSHAQEFGWARQFIGTQSMVAYGITTDAAGNVYACGYFEGVTDFDPGAGVSNLTASGGDDAFIVKLDSAGSLVWARRIGGANDQGAWGIAVDADGNVYTTGSFESTTDFDPGAGTFTLTAAGEYSSFVSKLDSGGNFVWAKMLGGSGYSDGEGIAVDGAGNVYTAGYFQGSGDYDPGAGVSTLTAAGNEGAYVSKLDSNGNFVWARQASGTNYSFAYSVALDANNNVLVTGAFDGTADFDPGAGTANLTTAGNNDAFVWKLDSAGNYLWSRRFGSGSYDTSFAVTTDANGNVYTTGVFLGTVDFDPGSGFSNLSSVGSQEDAFISKLDAAGNLVWARRMGGSSFDYGYDIAIGGDGSVYSTGYFQLTADFDPGAGVFNLTAAGSQDIFVSKLDSAGNFGWARAMGGTSDEYGRSMAIRGSNVYVTGRFEGTVDLDPSSNVLNFTSGGDRDAYIVNLTAGAGGQPVISSGGIVMANLLPKVATVSPLSIISVFGQNFSTETILYPNLASPGQLATSLGGTCLMMNGTALPIFAVTPGQINAQVSANKSFGPASFTVVTNCGTANAIASAPLVLEGPPQRELTSGAETVTVEATTPSFFIFNPVAANGYVAARFNTGNAAVAPAGLLNDQFGPSRPAKPGEIIVLYGTGWGDTTANLATGRLAPEAAEVLPSASRKITLGGVQLAAEDVLYVGVTPQTAGLYQAAIRIPANATPGNKQVVLTVYGKSTPVGPVIPIGAP